MLWERQRKLSIGEIDISIVELAGAHSVPFDLLFQMLRPRSHNALVLLGIPFLKSSVHTMYGQVASAREIKGGKFTLRAQISPNTTATVRLW